MQVQIWEKLVHDESFLKFYVRFILITVGLFQGIFLN